MTRTARIAAAAGLAAVTAAAHADPIIFSYTGAGSGSIAGVSFTDADFVITATGDTASREAIATGWFIDHATASIDIAGVGSFDFISPTRTFVNNPNSVVGFSRGGISGLDLFDGPTDTAFAAWDMLSSIGPITGSGQLRQWSLVPVETSGGVLLFDNAGSAATFSATVIPAPASAVLLALGGFVAARRRR